MAKKAKPSGVKVKEEKGSKRKSSSAVESVSKVTILLFFAMLTNQNFFMHDSNYMLK